MVWPTLISVSLAPMSYFFYASEGVANVTPSATTTAAVDLNRVMPSSRKSGRDTFAAPLFVNLQRRNVQRKGDRQGFAFDPWLRVSIVARIADHRLLGIGGCEFAAGAIPKEAIERRLGSIFSFTESGPRSLMSLCCAPVSTISVS